MHLNCKIRHITLVYLYLANKGTILSKIEIKILPYMRFRTRYFATDLTTVVEMANPHQPAFC